MADVVDERTHARAERSVSRRTFVRGCAAAAAGAAAVLPAWPLHAGEPLTGAAAQPAAATASVAAAREPVVGFRMDRPYLDPTGLAEPYVPPAGTRSGEALAALSEHEFLSRHPYG
ncbi:MAG TPA: twin-arginine translocation signal domain-containing protein [Steroidobacteraceae bacterium]|nr:twin-arginine translocation signal domain-containing protein [Steroidobacteraceae bacterium]